MSSSDHSGGIYNQDSSSDKDSSGLPSAVNHGEDDSSPAQNPDGDAIIIDPVPEGEPISESSDSSSLDESSSVYYEWKGRTYISSSFPHDGFYMRGGVGDPPPSQDSQDSHTDEVTSEVSSGESDLETSGDSSSYSDHYFVSE